MIRKVAFGFVAVIVLLLGYIALQPSHYAVSREILIQAPAEKIFPYLNHAKKMNGWNPWMKLDPQAKVIFSGPEEGVGARTEWEGSKDIGTGSAMVTESVANQRVQIKLEYVKPFQMVQYPELAIKPGAAGNTVVWSISGENTFMGRVMCAFGNMDKMVGDTFAKGLADLKNQVEGK